MNSSSSRRVSSRYCERSITASKLHLQPELHDARIDAHRADPSERARAGVIAAGICKIGVIEDVKDLPAEIQVGLLTKSGALDESHVEVALVRPSKNVSPQIS